MTSIPTPPATPDHDIQDTKGILLHSLDVLLERYLHLLDSYQTSRLNLTNQLCAGYFSLTQANFKSPNLVHYGQDSYDQRMQASAKIDIRNAYTATSPRVYLVTVPASLATISSESRSLTKPLIVAGEIQNEPSFRKATIEKPLCDPLNWFGILIPPTLRIAQASFKSALNEAVPNLINISVQMRDLEAKVEGLRHNIRSME